MACSSWFGAVILAILAFSVTCQEFAGCRESYYFANGECLQCPDNCLTCISDTNCTKCSSNNYGPICQHPCLEKCDDLCHKVYGYCTYGCIDGQYPEKDAAHCSNCPNNCTLCKSATECVMCRSGYHGNTCEQTCTNHCETCDQTNGNCTVCVEGYFNKDGRCHKCPDGCVGCFNSKNCTVCKVGYSKLHDGQCIMNCSSDESVVHLVSVGEDDFPFVNEQSDKNACIDTGGRFKSSSYKTTAPCIRAMSCPEGHTCLTVGNNKGTCAVIMTYECIQTCQPLNQSYHQCELNCSTANRNKYSVSFCLGSTGTISVDNVSTTTECLPASPIVETRSGYHRWETPLAVILTVLFMLAAGFVLYRYGRRCIELLPITSMRKSTSGEETGTNLGKSETTETVLIEQGTEPDNTFPKFMETRTDNPDTKPLQLNTQYSIPEVEPFINVHGHTQRTAEETMNTGERTELENNSSSNTKWRDRRRSSGSSKSLQDKLEKLNVADTSSSESL